MPQGEGVSVETAPIGERLSSIWTHARDFGRQRGGLPREDVSVDFVVEWQLQPVGDAEVATPEASGLHLQNLSA